MTDCFSPRVFLFIILPLGFYGCALPLGPKASVTRDRAFISYSPVPGDAGKLRLAVKDLIDLKGEVTTAGSQYVAKNSPPAIRDAALMERARRPDVAIVGKTNLTEFALGTTGANEYFGTPINPLDHHRIPGGSSSGSAVAVANNEADVAFGSDTAGSIRVPAACCGILGLKTTFSLVPLKGVFPLSPAHLDTIGPMAKDVPNLVKGMELLDPGFSNRYETAKANQPSPKQIKIGRLYVPRTDSKIEDAIDDALKASGFQVVRLDDRFRDRWIQAQLNGSTVAIADGWLSDRQYLGKLGVSLTTQATIRLGELQSNTAYKGALDARRAWRRELRRVFEKVDYIALPTLKSLPPHKLLFERSAIFEARVLGLQNTVAVNFAGNPAIAIPIPYPDRHFPVTSLQLIGPNLSEGGLTNTARLIMAKAPVTLKKQRR
ncbi:MAG TPA: amidase [Chthoniobacterales bacterium]|jgi:Asp-tRNA(Asn)/Glu-tRNA(Gln) amidotransferase A subunit family amidase